MQKVTSCVNIYRADEELSQISKLFVSLKPEGILMALPHLNSRETFSFFLSSSSFSVGVETVRHVNYTSVGIRLFLQEVA